MLTEVVLNEIVSSVVGTGFSQIVKGVFARSGSSSEDQILAQLIYELRLNGAQIDNLEMRLSRLERLSEMLISRAVTPQTITVVMSGQPPPAMIASTMYCRQCGMVPGKAEKCVGPLSGHVWKEM